ncbi:hypothetical protein [Nonomuraea sp. NPDC003709]|uniref:hypothetical protein n=1 Tax=Nonomuraea sp. NPDC003709 TaxID=3154450 RepID=UPI0033B98873
MVAAAATTLMAAPASASASTETTTAGAQLIRTKWAACTVRTRTLSQSYNNWLDGFARFRYSAYTYVSYR